ncbi:MAG: hypothetical protein KAW88_06270 [Candidatus Cloacimonetes bacterium]|nr:hypothetical protein [Candidatus Cloacimonadota bacterium]
MFDDVVLQALQKGYIKEKNLYTDSTHLKANANKHKYNRKEVAQNTKAYLNELEKAIEQDRFHHAKKPLPSKKASASPRTKEIKESKTDPESGFMTREGKP